MILVADDFEYSLKNGFYSGNSGDKDGVVIDNENWLIKYPKFIGDYTRTGQAPYSTSPLSEYIGSHVYEILGYPVHETMLVERNLKIAVACKDIEGENERLIEIRTIKNHKNDEFNRVLGTDFHSTGSSHMVDLNELLFHLDNNDVLTNISGIKERFWEQAVIDIFINNNDRNNGNWGILRSPNADRIAPIFDNGGCLQNKISEGKIVSILKDEDMVLKNAYNTQTAYGHDGHIYSSLGFLNLYEEYDELATALIKVVPLIEKNIIKIYDFINNIDERYVLSNGQECVVCSKERKRLYLMQLQSRYDNLLQAFYEKAIMNRF